MSLPSSFSYFVNRMSGVSRNHTIKAVKMNTFQFQLLINLVAYLVILLEVNPSELKLKNPPLILKLELLNVKLGGDLLQVQIVATGTLQFLVLPV